MRLTLGQLRRGLRRLLENGVDTEMRNMAGFFMAGGISNQQRGRHEDSVLFPPPGLGDEQEREDNEDDGEEQRKGQAGVRAGDRSGQTGPVGARG